MSFRTYETEAQMCEDITAHARQAGFVVYPETGGWDLLLVRHGIQIGVQAKLKFTHHLVAQALEGIKWLERGRAVRVGPHYRAVACQPAKSIVGDARDICRACHLLFLDLNYPPPLWLYREPWTRRNKYVWGKPTPVDWRYYRWRPNKRVWLPPAVPDLPAGVPSPSNVGKWQVAATRLQVIHETRGWVTREDARQVIAEVEAPYNPGTLLQRYYECTKIQDPKNPRLKQWRMHPRRRPASSQFPEAWRMVR